ncbi:MAG: serine protein kinase, partial [Candidatus Caldatribacteriota bacterium]
MASINLQNFMTENYNPKDFSHLHWQGSMQDYIDLLMKDPKIARNSFQRIYDMIMSYGTSSYTEYKKDVTRYHFFDDPIENGKDAIFGIDVHLMKLVNFFQSAALGYGTEKRVLLLHGPVGSAKSSIARLLKKGLEHYSKTDEGALYTYEWVDEEGSDILGGQKVFPSPMHEEPLKLIQIEVREKLIEEVQKTHPNSPYKIKIKGEVNPACRFILNEYMIKYNGDWTKVMNHIRVKRLLLSEKDRRGI